ncbi:MAG: hypothetical protein PHT07_12895 [Paludibacter sp.]|nr:hypothetical protein [Paludibacter sp.]
MKKSLLIVLVLASAGCFGQKTTRENDDSLFLKRQLYFIQRPGATNQLDQLSSSRKNAFEFNPFLEYKFPKSYILPLLPEYQHYYFINQFELENNQRNHFVLNDISVISTSHIQSNFIGLGGLNSVMGNYNFQIENVGVISAGIYAAKFNIYNSFFNDAGLNGNFKINLSERIGLNLFGQYSITGSKVAISPFISPLYPHSNYGGSLEFKVNNNWGLILGAENEYDVFLRKWVTRPFVMPVFY